jgi:tetratricopeptide (TPR) repeat protein
MAQNPEAAERIDRLLDAIDLVKAGRRQEALVILRSLIREDKDFEDAWLWMSIAVDTIDQSVICLDNVLRINPNNAQASGALYRLRAAEMASHSHRSKLRFYRDTAMTGLWILIMLLLFGAVTTFMSPAGG